MKNRKEYFLPLTEKQKSELEVLEIEAEIHAKKMTDDAWLADVHRRSVAQNNSARHRNNNPIPTTFNKNTACSKK